LIWEVTHHCNFGCDYCFQEHKRLHSPSRILNLTDLRKICSRLHDLNISEVLLTGGEIYQIKEELSDLCSEIKSLNLPISFSTNNYLRSEFVDQLMSFNPTSINISLEPKMSGNSAYNGKLIEAAKYVLEAADKKQIKVKITSVITKNNIDNYNEFFNLISEWTGKYPFLSSIYITNPYEIGFSKLGVRASFEQLRTIFPKDINGKSNPKIKYINFHRFNMPLQHCFAGSKYVLLEPTGSVYPCHLFANLEPETFLLGNLLQDDPSEIAQRLAQFASQTISAVNDYKSKTEKCKDCPSNNECGAGCLAEIISVGNLIEPRLVCRRIPPPRKNATSPEIPHLRYDVQPTMFDIASEEETKIIEHVKTNLRKSDHDLAHGMDHIESVVLLSRFIATKEHANLRIVTAAAYFHDFEPRRPLIFESHAKLSAEKAVIFLKQIGFSEVDVNQIYHCIVTSSYGASELGLIPETLEAKVVRDADWLDSIGARGIARVFAFASAHNLETLGNVEWDPTNPPHKVLSLLGPDPSPIYHFFSKLLWVKEGILTETGRRIAEVRHERLVRFLKEFKSETDEESLFKSYR
jgi:uncharacterized protein